MSHIVIPLHLRPVPGRGRGRPRKRGQLLTLRDGEGAVLLTRETFGTRLDELGERGLPRFHLFDTRTEARAAQLLFEQEETRLKGAASETEIGMLRDGEGVLVIFHRDRPVSGDGFDLIDHRLTRDRAVRGSWDLPEADCRAALSAPAGRDRRDLALAITAKLSALPPELIRDLQISLERVPGAYTGFVSVSPEEVRNDPRLEGVDPALLPDSLIQPFISRASQEAELGTARGGALDAVVDRLLAEHPELVKTDTETPEP